MGRVETRVYRRRRRHRRKARLGVLLLVAGGAILYAWGDSPVEFAAERLERIAAGTLTEEFDRTADTREVTLLEEAWYAIQTGIFSSADAAADKAEAYTARGAPGVVVREGEKWRVFIACYGTEADASSVRTHLQERQEVDTYLYTWRCPSLRLRLTGMAGQLDAVEAGFTLMTSVPAALRDAAIDLDAAQLTSAETLAQVSALEGQISLWEKTIRGRFDGKLPDLVKGMTAVMNGWSARFETLHAAADATALSAALKAESMGMYADVIAWRAQLAEQ